MLRSDVRAVAVLLRFTRGTVPDSIRARTRAYVRRLASASVAGFGGSLHDACPTSGSDGRVNLSFSNECALFGVGKTSIGVDVESLSRKWTGVADYVLAPNERSA